MGLAPSRRAAPPLEPAPPTRSTRPAPEGAEPDTSPRSTARGEGAPEAERAARRLAIDYLDFWSGPNAVTLDATPDFYGSRVEFHGRVLSARALFEEKRRFVQRWPVRSYTPRLGTMAVQCETAAQICTVRTAFDFAAENPDRGRRSSGTANLELGISVAGPRPVIVAETSRVVRNGRQGGPSLEEDED